MNYGDSTKQLELVLCKIYSHSSNPYNKGGGGFHLKTTTTTQQTNKQTNKSSILLLFSHTHSLLSHQKEIPPRKIRNGSNHKNEKKEMGFCKGKEDPF
jgi:hypothetical protein